MEESVYLHGKKKKREDRTLTSDVKMKQKKINQEEERKI